MRKAVSLVCIRDGFLLLVCDDDLLTWTVPGGKPEPNETDIECLRREIADELSGSEVSSVRFYRHFEGVSPHRGDCIEVNCYFGKIANNPKPSAEITAVSWEKDFFGKKISDVTLKIIEALRQDHYIP